ncbi:MAG: bifunctional 4-hydroxy-2-oxoglutarate aldolase/2-dehydro-3-deoxy-phosphogluconate aldolase [Clostridia bacterium]|nr:bifunctional 4-hydroxy-2-oxoglutarate aldolase/2-dehydro-3-deoxy-phosphogluconate aldolase [Clostridia bacterium]
MKDTVELIKKHKLIAIIRNVESEDLLPLCQALYDGGVRLVEVTFSSDGLSDEKIGRDIRLISEHFDGRLVVGAGTVITKKQVFLTRKAGGKFIISPNTNRSIIRKTKKLGLVSIPGALTPTEIAYAYSFGADFVKVFPTEALGGEYIKAVRAPLSNVPLLAVGGVDLANLKEYLKAGVDGVGIGSNIVHKGYIEQKNFAAIRCLAHEYVEIIESN